MVIDVFVAIIFLSVTPLYPIRFSRILRPFFSLDVVKGQKMVGRAIVRTIPDVLDVIVLLFVNILFFSLIGNMLFSSK